MIGGSTRQASVHSGLEALAGHAPDRVLIHDAARPFVTTDTISRVIDALDTRTAVLPAVQVTDTLKRVENGTVTATVARDGLIAAQTPQGFRFDDIAAAHRRAVAEGRQDFTDDAAIAEWAGLSVAWVEGDRRNDKITTASDLEAARHAHAEGASHVVTRVGTGFDVHAFAPGNSVQLCGVEIAHNRALAGHSDADVGLHALCDALYGAVGSGDIGHHFPPSDARWKGTDSAVFLAHARREVAARGGRIVHVDVTLICERPKIGPHRDAMVARLATLLDLDHNSVSVKATTSERLGFTGRGEGIAAQAVATVVTNEGRA